MRVFENCILRMLDFPVLYPEGAIILLCTLLAIVVAIVTFPIKGAK